MDRSAIRTAVEAHLGAISDLGPHFRTGFAAMNSEDWRMLGDAVLRHMGFDTPHEAPDSQSSGVND
jgi:hypothetical protein